MHFSEVFNNVIKEIGKPTFYISNKNYKNITMLENMIFSKRCYEIREHIRNIRKVYPFVISYKMYRNDQFVPSSSIDIKCFDDSYYTLNTQQINFCYIEDVAQKENTVVSKDEP